MTDCEDTTAPQGPPIDELLRAENVAELLGCSTRTVHRLVTRGELPSPYRMGRMCRWRASDLHAWLSQRETTATPPSAKEVAL